MTTRSSVVYSFFSKLPHRRFMRIILPEKVTFDLSTAALPPRQTPVRR